jgi:phosphoglycolate phosphatase-like HAD superfamily hydrolase
MFVVFDLDGTLADCTHRIHLLDQMTKRERAVHAGYDTVEEDASPLWDQFYAECVNDKPILPIINTMRAYRMAGAEVAIWTGRSDLVEFETRRWLADHGVPWVPMKMRPHGDHSNDAAMKQHWLHERREAGLPDPEIVFEDRQRVVDMWRSEGIICAQVAPGKF